MGVVLYFAEHPEGRAAAINDRAEREYTRRFTAVTSDATTDSLVVLAYPTCPRTWDPYTAADGSADLGAWCYEVHAEVDPNDPTTWRVTARYSCKVSRPDLWEIPNPLLRPSEIEWDSETVTVPLEYDLNGEAVMSTAYGLFDPPPEREEQRLVLRTTKNLADYDPSFFAPYIGAINGTPWFGFATGSVLCRRVRSARGFENGIFFWRTSFEFVYRSLPVLTGTEYATDFRTGISFTRVPWDRVFLNQDYYELDGAERVPIFNAHGQPVSRPWPLLSNGSAANYNDSPVWLVYRDRPRLNFNLLPVP